jgi:hypothetical protein
MSPHGSRLEGTGVPVLACHTTCPVASLSATTSSLSVATITSPSWTSGWAQMSPPRLGETHADTNGTDPVLLVSTPERSASPR